MIKFVICIAMVLTSNFAFSKTVCDQSTTLELEACVHENFESSNHNLNRIYDNALKDLHAPDRLNLLSAQRAWIKYKEKYCRAAYDGTNPGEEAAVDMWSCLDAVTESRIKEIQHLNSSSGLNDYTRSIILIANLYEYDDTNKVIAKLINDTPDAKNPDWIQYANLNCKMTALKLSEDQRACIARMNFYKNW
jgi:uncharacterized protein YecT (DUF1311 family)